MGEWSKRIGEYGEKVTEVFFAVIGWNDMIKGIQLPCLNPDKHLNEKGNPKETHGIDFLYSYRNPLVSGQLNNVLISTKCKTDKYPNSPTKLFKGFMEDLITTMECYNFSEVKASVASAYEFTNNSDCGVLFWINTNKDSSDDLITSISTARVIETATNSVIYILDNKRVAFILEVMKFVKTKTEKFNYSFYYPNTGQNLNPVSRENVGQVLPVEYLNSSIIPVRLVNKDNDKEVSLLLATVDNFEENDLMRLIGLAKDITTEIVGEVIIAFPDYTDLEHEQLVSLTKQKFQAADFTKKVSVVNFLNPISVFES